MAKKKSAKKSSAKFNDRICNLIPSRETETDWQMSDALAGGMLAAPAALPASVDLRQTWWKIGDQSVTGSCVGWATADGVMRYMLVKAGRLTQASLLSPRYVWMASKETDNFVTRPETFIEGAGTSLKAAADIARKYGVVTEDLLPFKTTSLMFTGNPNTFYATAATRKAASYVNLGKDPNQWKTWLATTGPILAGLSVDKTWDNAANTSGNLDVFQPATARGGHAICIVGYTSDRFIIRNSWGTTWGKDGFGFASHAYISAGFFAESYGFTL